MILRGLKTGFCKGVAIAMAVALTLTLPSQGRCDDVPRGNLILVLVEIAKPKKPQSKPLPACASPCCPMGTCTGAATLPCCPMARCVQAPVCIPTQGSCSACPVHKPEACAKSCCEKPCCEQAGSCCKADQALPEMREQIRMLRNMQVMMKEMQNTINALQVEVQTLRQNQVNVPILPGNPWQFPMPYKMPQGGVYFYNGSMLPQSGPVPTYNFQP
jgi:hypothetical protein